jgi:hypothetical protein
LTNTP